MGISNNCDINGYFKQLRHIAIELYNNTVHWKTKERFTNILLNIFAKTIFHYFHFFNIEEKAWPQTQPHSKSCNEEPEAQLLVSAQRLTERHPSGFFLCLKRN